MTVNGLSPGKSYTFYLAAGNAVGIGAAVKFRVRTPRRVSQNQQSGNHNHIRPDDFVVLQLDLDQRNINPLILFIPTKQCIRFLVSISHSRFCFQLLLSTSGMFITY